MSTLVLDAAPGRLGATRIEPGREPRVVDARVLPAPAPLDALEPELLRGVDTVVHRFLHAPAGYGEVVGDADADVLAAAGELQTIDTATRLATWRAAIDRWSLLRHRLVFDTAFFADLPIAASRYALPLELADELGLRRRGRHGPIHRRAAARAGDGRVVSVVLGAECSVAAVVDGRPVEVSAGVTELEGLPGATTCGDLDPAVLLYLVDSLGWSPNEVERAVRSEGGLAGLSRGRGSLAELEAADDPEARLALDHLASRVRRYVGAYAAVMDGLDALTIAYDPADDAPALREHIVGRLSYLGVGERVPPQTWACTPALAAALAAA